MHQIIRIIVYADSEESALHRAENILDNNLVGDGYGLFDYGTLFDNNGSEVSGKGRWGDDIPSVVLADSEEGEELIKEGMEYTKESFLDSIKNMREMIGKYSDEELSEEERSGVKEKILKELTGENDEELEAGYFRYYCRNIGYSKGSNIWLYDDDGEGIDKSSHLKSVLNKWGSKNSLKVYVVPVDVHS